MKRPRTTSFVAPPPPEPVHEVEPERPAMPTWRELAPVVAALIVTLDTMEGSPKAGPAAKVHRSAIRRQGEAAAVIGGAEAMEAALRQVADTDLERAERRARIIREAWAGLPGWRS